MTNGTSELTKVITHLRADSISAILALCDLVNDPHAPPPAKILAARSIISFAATLATLTKLRAIVRANGGKPCATPNTPTDRQ